MIIKAVYPGLHMPDQEPWGRAFTYSFTFHALIALLFVFGVHRHQVSKTVLTEISFVEAPPLPAVKVAPDSVVIPGEQGKTGGPGSASKGRASGTVIGSAPNKGFIQSHPELQNKSQISSEQGTPDGDVVVSKPLAGPIVALDQFGLVGKKKGSLMSYAAQTEGRPGKGASLPPGLDERDSDGNQIVLARANLADLQRAESSLGTPLISQRVVGDAMGGGTGDGSSRLKDLATGALGSKKKASFENLKANPLEKDKWGKATGPFSMEGPLKYRKILKLELPPYPRWAEDKAIESSVSIRLWVDPRGRVKDNMYLEKTSGYHEIDSLAMNYLAKFIFVKIPDDQPQEDEWGVATFRFELKK